jgi:hypothetical protein
MVERNMKNQQKKAKKKLAGPCKALPKEKGGGEKIGTS